MTLLVSLFPFCLLVLHTTLCMTDVYPTRGLSWTMNRVRVRVHKKTKTKTPELKRPSSKRDHWWGLYHEWDNSNSWILTTHQDYYIMMNGKVKYEPTESHFRIVTATPVPLFIYFTFGPLNFTYIVQIFFFFSFNF